MIIIVTKKIMNNEKFPFKNKFFLTSILCDPRLFS